jgi:putative ABC transport system permease protein
MFRLTIKELAARKVRLLTTAFAVLLGVAFMAGTLVFTDTIGATYDSALAKANAGVDVYIRTPSQIHLGYGQSGPRLDASLAQQAAAVPGVEHVALRINGYAQVLGRDGKPVGDVAKSPAFGTNWVSVAELNPYRLWRGHAPANDHEIVIDKTSASKGHIEVGDRVTVLTKHQPEQFTVAGIAKFDRYDSPAGATAVLFTDAKATELLASPGQADGIAITIAPGAAQEPVRAAVAQAVGGNVQVITGSELIKEDQETLRKQIGQMATIFYVFAVVAVFVGAFIINNTFSIIVAQRKRDMAMLRAVGASGRQVKRSVLIEAAVIGVVASAVGLVAGIGIAAGLRQLMSVFGFDMPDGPTIITAGAMTLSFVVGVMVTVLSAWLPARRAAKIAPIAALRDVNVDRSGVSARRAIAGTVVTAGGVAALIAGLGGALPLVGIGAVGVFAGIAVLGPVLARPISKAFGIPLRARGIAGELATRNASRNPKRTARTAAALMIGVALVAFMSVFAASAKTSLAGSLETQFTGTHIIDAGATDNSAGLSPQLAETLRHTTGVSTVTEARLSPAVIDHGETPTFFAFDTTTVDRTFKLGSVEGDVHGLGVDGVAVSRKRADAEGWHLGSTIPATFPGGTTTLTVKAIYSSGTDWVGTIFVDLSTFAAHGADDLDFRVYVAGDESVIKAVADGYPSATVLDKHGFLKLVSAQIDTMVGMFDALLMLAVVIALLGIANTLALSIFERTRELGLLRAVGMGRRQLRSTIRWESIIIAVFGTTLGLAIGTFFGWAIVRALADQGIKTLTIPTGTLIVVTVIAALAGATAAVLPARRAAKLDVLTALVTV